MSSYRMLALLCMSVVLFPVRQSRGHRRLPCAATGLHGFSRLQQPLRQYHSLHRLFQRDEHERVTTMDITSATTSPHRVHLDRAELGKQRAMGHHAARRAQAACRAVLRDLPDVLVFDGAVRSPVVSQWAVQAGQRREQPVRGRLSAAGVAAVPARFVTGSCDLAHWCAALNIDSMRSRAAR